MVLIRLEQGNHSRHFPFPIRQQAITFSMDISYKQHHHDFRNLVRTILQLIPNQQYLYTETTVPSDPGNAV